MNIPIFDNELVECYLDDSLPVLVHRWKRELTGSEFRDQVKRVLDEYKKLKQAYTMLAWLADTTSLGELDEETEDWLVNEWEQLLFVQAGVTVHAVVLGASIFADYPMEKFKADAEKKFQKLNVKLGVFSNREDAYQWIVQTN